MNLYKANILIASGFAAAYGGNFISMLKALALKLKLEYQCNIIFVFPQQSFKPWLEDLSKEYIVRYTCQTYKYTSKEFQSFIKDFNINLIHTHFEVYDVPVAKAIHRSKRDVKLVLHLHDFLTLESQNFKYAFLRKLKKHITFWLQYGYWCKNAFYIGVCKEVTQFASHYRKHIFSFPKKQFNSDNIKTDYSYAEVVINGIDVNRLSKNNLKNVNKDCIRFLSFGGNAYGKGISTILKAAENLATKGINFELFITNGYKTPQLLAEYYDKKIPNWLKIIEQTENISQLFNICDVYISASHYETMSMAIAEASIFGLPVIQSDISGTLWNSDTPSSFLFKVGDACDLEAKMINIMKADKKLLEEQCKVSSQMNTKRLDMNIWCNKILNIYEKL